MSKVVTVFGATGGQGGGVVSRLLKAINNDEGDYHIRAITRNPDGPKGIDLKNKGSSSAIWTTRPPLKKR